MSVPFRGRVVQVTNISPTSSMEQMRTLFGHIGVISEIVLYPLEGDDVQSKVCYIKYSDEISAEVALHLNNTIFLDRALIVLPLVDGNDIIPDEKAANIVRAPPNTAAGVLPRSANWPLDVISMVVGRPGEQAIHTIEPRLVKLGFPVYPPLPAATDINRIEEIRRTVLISNLDPKTDGNEVLEFFNAHSEVKCVRMAGTFDDRAAYVEFTEQPSVVKAFGLMGATLGDRQIMVQHSNCAIIKPNTNLPVTDDAVKKISSDAPANIEKLRSRSRSKGRGDRSKRSRSRKRRSSRSKSRRRSRSRHRSKSGGRRRSRSRSRRHRSRSRSRDRRRVGRDRSRSRGHKKSRRSRSPSEHRRRSRSRDRLRDKHDRDSGRRRDRSRELGRERTRRDRSRDKGRDRSRERDRGRDKERDRGRDRSKNRGRDLSRDKIKEKDKSRAGDSAKSSKRNRSRSTSKNTSSRKRSEIKEGNGVKSPSSRHVKEEDAKNLKMIDTAEKNVAISLATHEQESDATSNDGSSRENGTDNDTQDKLSESDKPAVVGVKLAGPEDMDFEVPMVEEESANESCPAAVNV